MKKFLVLALFLASATALAQPGAPKPQPDPAPGVPVADPPTGPGLGTQKPVDTRPLTLDPKQLEALSDLEKEHERFTEAARKHDERMRTIAKREFDTRTADLTKRYSDRIAKAESQRGKLHGDTIAKLEKFLQDHPAHEQFTPDAMFRLADLYLDRADAEVDAKLVEQEKLPPNPNAAAIVADYTPSLQLWEKILTEFPKYRQTSSTMYLLAYYGKQKDERRSLTIFLALACSNKFKWNDKPSKPPTRDEALKRVEAKQLRDPYSDCQPYPNAEVELIRHAWVRGVADYHFTVPGELDEGIAAYLKVANGGQESRLYAESLYKLAWSYYKRDKLEDSIRRFDESVALYDKIVAEGGQPALELRDESIQYIAVAFTDPWEGETQSAPTKAMERAQAFYKGRENEPHVRDVWVAMGKAFADLQAWDQSIDSYRIALGPPWELHPKNPVTHQEMVNVFELKGDKFAADSAAAELAIRYACPGTKWCQANEKDREAMETQRRISERALYAAARNMHSNATTLRKEYDTAAKKDPAAKQEYLALYAKAVELYRAFIDTYPDSDYVYEFNYNIAEALYWSEKYNEAIVAYTWVRDNKNLGTQHYIESARSILNSYEKQREILVAEGKLQPLRVLTVADLKALPQPLQPQPIPEFDRKLQAEYDNFQNVVNDPAAAPGQGTNAALISLAYLHLDDAIARFTKVMDKFCLQPEAVKAKDGILAIYLSQENFDAIEQVNRKFIAANCGDQKTRDDALVQNRSLNFSRANKLFEDKKYTQAAEAFYRFYKTAPQNDKDLPDALYSAAVSYKLGDRPKTAISLFKEFTQRPEKTFKDSPNYLDALRLQAATHQAAYQYDEAVRIYKDLHKLAKTAKVAPKPIPGEKPRTLKEISLDALFNAALAAELNRDFKQALQLYGQYQGEETDRRKKDRALWSVGNIHRQSGDVNAMEETHKRWRATYGNDPGNEDDFVATYYESAQMRRKKAQAPIAARRTDETIAAWKQKGAIKGSRGAKMAGEFELEKAEEHLEKRWVPYKITKAAATVKEAEAQGLALTKQRTTAEDKYLALDPYATAELTMAAKVRYGEIQYEYSTKLADAPIPTPIQKLANAGNTGPLEAYQKKLDENVKKYLDVAKAQWLEVVDLSKKGGVSNKWSRLALENLAREFPADFQALRQEIIQGTEAP